MSAEAFLGMLILVIFTCAAIIILVYTIDIVASSICSAWDLVCELRDAIQDFVNRRTNR